jgi:release factor glutamine methyltransferase
VTESIVAALRAAGCVFAEDEARLLTESASAPAQLAAMVARRVAGLPLEHVLGWAGFCGLRLAVDPGVFVPRQRTALLVAEAVRVSPPAAVVVDLACGTGAVGLAVVGRVPGAALHAVDIEPAAVACARRNLAGVGGSVYLGDLFQPLPARLKGGVDTLVANVPYVPTAAVALMPPEARLYEPLVALNGGDDGLDVVRRVANGAVEWLAAGGHLFVETGAEQAPAAVQIFTAAGLRAWATHDDELGATVVSGQSR